MNISKEFLKIANDYTDLETCKYIICMCKKCKFYDNECTKKRVIRECARKGLKDKE